MNSKSARRIILFCLAMPLALVCACAMENGGEDNYVPPGPDTNLVAADLNLLSDGGEALDYRTYPPLLRVYDNGDGSFFVAHSHDGLVVMYPWNYTIYNKKYLFVGPDVNLLNYPYVRLQGGGAPGYAFYYYGAYIGGYHGYEPVISLEIEEYVPDRLVKICRKAKVFYNPSDVLDSTYYFVYDGVSDRVYEYGWFDIKVSFGSNDFCFMMQPDSGLLDAANFYTSSGVLLHSAVFTCGTPAYRFSDTPIVIQEDLDGDFNYQHMMVSDPEYFGNVSIKDTVEHKKIYYRPPITIFKAGDRVMFRGFGLWKKKEQDLMSQDKTVQDVVTHNNDLAYSLHPEVAAVSSSRSEGITRLDISVSAPVDPLDVRVENRNPGEDAYDLTNSRLAAEDFEVSFSVAVSDSIQIAIAPIDRYELTHDGSERADVIVGADTIIDHTVPLDGLYPGNIPLYINGCAAILGSDLVIDGASLEPGGGDLTLNATSTAENQALNLHYQCSANFSIQVGNTVAAEVVNNNLIPLDPVCDVLYNPATRDLDLGFPLAGDKIISLISKP